jgi:hypothetical protein
MIRVSVTLVLLCVAQAFVPAQTPRCAESLIGSDRVGIVRIGMPVDSVRARCRVVRDTTEMNEGEDQRVIYALVGSDTLRIEVVQNAVWRISVRRPGFATRDSIRVGMPLSRFLVGRHPTIGVGEGRVYLFDPRHRGNSFGLSDEAYARIPKLTPAGLSRLPPSTVIDEILVTGISTVRRESEVRSHPSTFRLPRLVGRTRAALPQPGCPRATNRISSTLPWRYQCLMSTGFILGFQYVGPGVNTCEFTSARAKGQRSGYF